VNQLRVRLFFMCVLFALGAAAITLRLFTVQVLRSSEYSARSRLQSQQRCMMPASRGGIYDRYGRVLAASPRNEYSLAGNPAADKFLKRVYPLGEASGPLLGYIGKDGYGLGGVEFSFDRYLRGEDGWTIVQKDGRNRRYHKMGLPHKGPRTGDSVYLTIDAEIQKIVYGVLKQSVAELKAQGGTGMVMDPATGKILAMVNEPSFDPNFPERYSLDRRKNACIGAIYEPGSTFKLVTAAAALQDNIKRERDVLDGNHGVFEINHETIRDHEPYGKLTFMQAMAYSSNVCFAKIATQVGASRLFRYTQNFGFGMRCGVELPGEENGILHPIRSWSGRTLVTMGIGQEISVTLLQMMVAYAAVANSGIMVKPQICEKIVTGEGAVVTRSAVKPVRRVLDEETSRRLCAMLKTVVDSGTGKNAGVIDIAVAGKTGTSQKLDKEGYSKTRSWASFIGFLPVGHPVLLCGVVIDEPAANLMGGTAAAPAFRKIITEIISRPGLEYAEKVLNNRVAPVREVTAETFTGTGAMPMADAMNTVRGKKNEVPSGTPAGGGWAIPDCRGKDVRDAVNLINRYGLVPFVIGAGTVQRQSPPAGTLNETAQPCTLICAFGG
jgi:cell division protein FtsI (penicillin-binding protein 3)